MKAEYFPPKENVILQNEAPTDLYVLVSGAMVRETFILCEYILIDMNIYNTRKSRGHIGHINRLRIFACTSKFNCNLKNIESSFIYKRKLQFKNLIQPSSLCFMLFFLLSVKF